MKSPISHRIGLIVAIALGGCSATACGSPTDPNDPRIQGARAAMCTDEFAELQEASHEAVLAACKNHDCIKAEEIGNTILKASLEAFCMGYREPITAIPSCNPRCEMALFSD